MSLLPLTSCTDSSRKDYAENRPISHYEPLGSTRNPLYVCSDTQALGKNISAGIALLDAFTSAPSDRSHLSTRFTKIIRVCYYMGSNQQVITPLVPQPSSNGSALPGTEGHTELPVGSVAGLEYFTLFTEPMRIGFKDSANKTYQIFSQVAAALADVNPQLYHISPTLRDTIATDMHAGIGAVGSGSASDTLAASFAHLGQSLLEAGISEELWNSCILALCACIHLQTLTLVGADQAIISAGTKNCVPYAEEILGLEIGSLSGIILTKTEEKMAGRVVSTDNKLPDAKIIADGLVVEIYRRVMECLCTALGELSFTAIAQELTGHSCTLCVTFLSVNNNGGLNAGTGGYGLPPSFSGYVPLNIIDLPGWEYADGGACNGFSQMVSIL
jgi:hypothetical protein